MNPRDLRTTLCAIVPLLALTAGAEPAVEDSFPTGTGYYTANASLVSQSTFAAGFTGAWLEAYTGAASPNVISTGLSYSANGTQVAATRGAAEYPAAGSAGRAGRVLSQSYNNSTSGDVYFSFLVKLDAVAASYRAVELHNGGFDDNANRQLQIAVGEDITGNGTTSDFIVRLFNNNNDGFAANLGAADTSVNFFVGKINFGPNNDEDDFYIWRNPADLTTEPGSADFSKTGFNIQLDRLSIANFSADGIIVDEVRFGTSWADVTAIDSDNDGMRDAWEQLGANNLNVGTDDSASDKDSDNVSNIDEYLRKTNADDTDTDDDGLLDDTDPEPRLAGPRDVTFQVNMRVMAKLGKFDPADEIRVVGAYWNGFSPGSGPLMGDGDSDGIYTVTVSILGAQGNDFGGYKFWTNNSTLTTQWGDGYEKGFDRTATLGAAGTPQTIPVDYFRNDNIDNLGTYYQWADTAGLDLGDAESDLTSNPDGDADDNRAEFLFGGNPTAGGSLAPSITRVGTNVIVNWLQRSDGVGSPTLYESGTLSPTPAWAPNTDPQADAGDQFGVPAGYVRREATVPIDSTQKYLQVVGSLP